MNPLHFIKNLLQASDNKDDIKNLSKKVGELESLNATNKKNIEENFDNLNKLAILITNVEIENKNLQNIFLEILTKSDSRFDFVRIIEKLKEGKN